MSDKWWMRLNNPALPLGEFQVGVIGIPYDGAVSRKAGACAAPDILRKISKDVGPLTESQINLSSLKLRDLGNIEVRNTLRPEVAHKQIVAYMSSLLHDDFVLATIGGDHSITCGVLEAYDINYQVGVVWFDSHPDLMNKFGGISYDGFSQYSHACSLRRIMELPRIDPANVLLVGIRNTFPEEYKFITQYDIDTIYARDLSTMSPSTLSKRIIRKFANLKKVYVSFDIDVLDPSAAPGTGVPVPGGISSRYLLDFIQSLHCPQSEKPLSLLGFDIVEISPPLDVNQITCMVGMRIFAEMLGFIKRTQGEHN